MGETNKTSGGLNRITPAKWRLATLVAATALGVLAVAWLEISAWRGLRKLERQLAGFRPQTFHMATEIKSEIAHMNAALLRFELSNDTAERDAFQSRARNLKDLIGSTRPFLHTQLERTLTQRVESLYESYLAEVTPFLEKGITGVRRDSAQKLQEQIDRASADLLESIGQLIEAQQRSFEIVVSSWLGNTAAAQRAMRLSALLLIVPLAAIAASLYLILVTPLRAQLTETQSAIERQEKLASLGTLATGVAHEIRNPLTAIKFRLFSLKKILPAATTNSEDIEVIEKEINRLERLVKEFLLFARPAEPALAPVPAQRLLQDVQALLQPQAVKNTIAVNVEDANGIWLQADRQQLEQVLINLVQNAAESIGREGSITLRARHGISKIDRQSRPVVILEVSDTGNGIPADAEARIFDPFFSTKEGGTGLGLSIAARIVEMHGGFIQYQSDSRQGTTFSIVLPRPATNGTNDSNR